MIELHTLSQVLSLPDGTVIEWLRIEDDRTSRAVAIVNVEIEFEDTMPPGPAKRVVWISPGGWAPMTPEMAGLQFPVKVLDLGPFRADHMTPDVQPLPWAGTDLQFIPGEIGQTINVRVEALHAATRYFASVGSSTVKILPLADAFVEWLERER